MKLFPSFLIIALLGFTSCCFAADDPECLATYKAEIDRIQREAGREAAANPPGEDINAQQQFLQPVYDAMQAAAEQADECNRASRPQPGSAEFESALQRATECSTTANRQSDALHQRFATGGDLTFDEQTALREEEDRIIEERNACQRALEKP